MKKNKQISFEKALKELEQISSNIESDKLTVDELVEIFERGSELSDYCIKKLNKSKLKIEEILNLKKNK